MITRSGGKFLDHLTSVTFLPDNTAVVKIETDDGKFINFVQILLSEDHLVILKNAIAERKNVTYEDVDLAEAESLF